MDELEKNFKNRSLFKQAFIHRSYLNETKEAVQSNERLEFLGDAVLEFLVSRQLYLSFPELEEGKLTTLRSALVRTETLAKIADQLGLGNRLLLSRGERESGGHQNVSLLANVFEAFLGALYLDQGLEAAETFLKKYLLVLIPTIISKRAYLDFKSQLQEAVQNRQKVSPSYHVVSEEGPDHQKIFTVAVFAGGEKLATGSGKNKQEAQQQAAKLALERLQLI